MIPILDLKTQYDQLRDEIAAAIQGVLESGAFVLGPDVKALEQEVADYCRCRHGVGVASGTDALRLSLAALEIGAGDEVITTPFTFVATANTISHSGARPVFVDIDPLTYNLDPALVAAAVTPATKAIVPVHLYGQPAEMDAIMAIAEQHGLAVIEDAAQAIGAEYQGRRAGSIGHVGCLSFYPTKNLGAYGDAGAILTNDDAFFERVRMIANHGSRKKYYNEVVGVNSRLDTLQAAVLAVKLRHLDRYTAARQAAADRYDALLADLPGLTLPYRASYGTHVFHQYTVRVAPEVAGGRDGLQAHLRARGIPSMVYYPVPLHRLPVFAEQAGPVHDDLAHTEQAAAEVLSLPMHTELTDEQLAYIADAVRAYVQPAA